MGCARDENACPVFTCKLLSLACTCIGVVCVVLAGRTQCDMRYCSGTVLLRERKADCPVGPTRLFRHTDFDDFRQLLEDLLPRHLATPSVSNVWGDLLWPEIFDLCILGHDQDFDDTIHTLNDQRIFFGRDA